MKLNSAKELEVYRKAYKLNNVVNHPRANLRTTWRGCIDLQIGQFIQALRGESDRYWPIEIK